MKKLILFTALLCFTAALQAQNKPRFTVEVSSDSVLFGNYIEVKFRLENAKGTDFEAPAFPDFQVISGPHYASSFSMINGEANQSTTYSFQIAPTDIGNFYLEPASIRVQGEVLETKPVTIIVVPNPDGIIEQPSRGMQFQFDWGRSRSLQTPDTLQQKEQQLKFKKKRKVYKM